MRGHLRCVLGTLHWVQGPLDGGLFNWDAATAIQHGISAASPVRVFSGCAADIHSRHRAQHVSSERRFPDPTPYLSIGVRKVIVLVSFCHDQFYHFLSQVAVCLCQSPWQLCSELHSFRAPSAEVCVEAARTPSGSGAAGPAVARKLWAAGVRRAELGTAEASGQRDATLHQGHARTTRHFSRPGAKRCTMRRF
jgi:hypothetical protein